MLETEVRPVVTPAAPSITAVYMRCCAAWEEDDETVDWGSLVGPGYLHWGPAQCRR